MPRTLLGGCLSMAAPAVTESPASRFERSRCRAVPREPSTPFYPPDTLPNLPSGQHVTPTVHTGLHTSTSSLSGVLAIFYVSSDFLRWLYSPHSIYGVLFYAVVAEEAQIRPKPLNKSVIVSDAPSLLEAVFAIFPCISLRSILHLA